MCFAALFELVPTATASGSTELMKSPSQSSKAYSVQSPLNTSSWYQGRLRGFAVSLHAAIGSYSLISLVLRLAAFAPSLSSNLLQFAIVSYSTLFSSSNSISNITAVLKELGREGLLAVAF